MSLTRLPPFPQESVPLAHTFFAKKAINSPLPAEQKFRENTVYVTNILHAARSGTLIGGVFGIM